MTRFAAIRLFGVRRALVASAVLGYALATTGFPVWRTAEVRSVGGQAFPCQDHACGCGSAEQCWSDCCCFSPAERMAWAERHGIQPPPFSTDKIARAASSESGSSCCNEQSRENCHSSLARPTRPLPRPTSPEGEVNGDGDEPSVASKPRVRWVSGIQARRCRGLATEWNVFGGAVAPPPPRLTWAPRDLPRGAVQDIAFFPLQVYLDRETPPG